MIRFEYKYEGENLGKIGEQKQVAMFKSGLRKQSQVCQVKVSASSV